MSRRCTWVVLKWLQSKQTRQLVRLARLRAGWGREQLFDCPSHLNGSRTYAYTRINRCRVCWLLVRGRGWRTNLEEKAPEPGIRRGRALSMPTRERSAIAATGRRDLEGGGGAEKEACKRLARVRRRRGEVVCLLYITRKVPVRCYGHKSIQKCTIYQWK
jgi:hypothetical protein